MVSLIALEDMRWSLLVPTTGVIVAFVSEAV